MCIAQLFGSPKAQSATITAPAVAPAPSRADEENRNAVDEQMEALRRRRGRAATIVTGGLGDTSFGTNVERPQVTALGQG